MARTYRGRHLPRLTGTGAKLIDSRCYRRFGDKYLRRWDRDRERRADVNCGPPVEWVGGHPWIRAYCTGVSIKTWYKTLGNRLIRRKETVLMSQWAFLEDDFEEYLPGKKDGWDPWVLS